MYINHMVFKEISVGVVLWCFREAVKHSEIWQFWRIFKIGDIGSRWDSEKNKLFFIFSSPRISKTKNTCSFVKEKANFWSLKRCRCSYSAQSISAFDKACTPGQKREPCGTACVDCPAIGIRSTAMRNPLNASLCCKKSIYTFTSPKFHVSRQVYFYVSSFGPANRHFYAEGPKSFRAPAARDFYTFTLFGFPLQSFALLLFFDPRAQLLRNPHPMADGPSIT